MAGFPKQEVHLDALITTIGPGGIKRYREVSGSELNEDQGYTIISPKGGAETIVTMRGTSQRLRRNQSTTLPDGSEVSHIG